VRCAHRAGSAGSCAHRATPTTPYFSLDRELRMNVQDGSRTVPGGQCFRGTAPVRLLAKGAPWSAAAACERRDDGTERSGRLRVVRLIAADCRSPSAEHARRYTHRRADDGLRLTDRGDGVLRGGVLAGVRNGYHAVHRRGVDDRSSSGALHRPDRCSTGGPGGRASAGQERVSRDPSRPTVAPAGIVRLCDRDALRGGTACRGRHAVPPCR